MSNNALLVGMASAQAFPLLQKKPVKHEIIACGEWQVPLLWFALFRLEDLKTWKWPGKNGPPFELRAPIVARQVVNRRLKEAVPLLEAAVPKVKSWKQHLDLLAKAVNSLKSNLKFITCEWEEITTLDPQAFYANAEWLLKFFGGETMRQPSSRLEKLCGTKLNRVLRDPAKSTAADFEKQDWKTLAGLLGVEWEKKLPWTPRPETKAKPVYLHDLILRGDLRAVKAALSNNVPVEERDVADAARKDVRLLRLLLEAGGDANGASFLYGCPLLAAFNSRDRVSAKVRMLLDAGANVNESGMKHKVPFVLNCCLYHGMEFAKEVIAGSNAENLGLFIKNTSEDWYIKKIKEKRITWATEFVALAKQELAKRGGKRGQK